MKSNETNSTKNGLKTLEVLSWIISIISGSCAIYGMISNLESKWIIVSITLFIIIILLVVLQIVGRKKIVSLEIENFELRTECRELNAELRKQKHLKEMEEFDKRYSIINPHREKD